jgi:hypothetical protein
LAPLFRAKKSIFEQVKRRPSKNHGHRTSPTAEKQIKNKTAAMQTTKNKLDLR